MVSFVSQLSNPLLHNTTLNAEPLNPSFFENLALHLKNCMFCFWCVLFAFTTSFYFFIIDFLSGKELSEARTLRQSLWFLAKNACFKSTRFPSGFHTCQQDFTFWRSMSRSQTQDFLTCQHDLHISGLKLSIFGGVIRCIVFGIIFNRFGDPFGLHVWWFTSFFLDFFEHRFCIDFSSIWGWI